MRVFLMPGNRCECDEVLVNMQEQPISVGRFDLYIALINWRAVSGRA